LYRINARSFEIKIRELEKLIQEYGFLPCQASDKQKAIACQSTEKYSVWQKPARKEKNRYINKLSNGSEGGVFNT